MFQLPETARVGGVHEDFLPLPPLPPDKKERPTVLQVFEGGKKQEWSEKTQNQEHEVLVVKYQNSQLPTIMVCPIQGPDPPRDEIF